MKLSRFKKIPTIKLQLKNNFNSKLPSHNNRSIIHTINKKCNKKFKFLHADMKISKKQSLKPIPNRLKMQITTILKLIMAKTLHMPKAYMNLTDKKQRKKPTAIVIGIAMTIKARRH
jgi:hypothetical protein